MSNTPAPKRILFVCLGNICRSPMAEGVFTRMVKEARLERNFVIDSAGTSGHHSGEAPDARMIRTAARRGMDITHQRSRQLCSNDFLDFDLILAMDRSNLRDIEELRRRSKHGTAVVELFRKHDPKADSPDVPDPWFGGPEGFEDVADLMERTCERLLRKLSEAL